MALATLVSDNGLISGNWLATANAAAREVVEFGNGIGIAKDDIASGATGAIYRFGGEFTAAAATGVAWAAGAQLYWNTTSDVLTTVASGAVVAGIATALKASATATANFCLMLNGLK